MRVKVRGQDKWIEADEVGVVIELSEADKKNIGFMAPGHSVYYQGPDFEGIGKWIAEENPPEKEVKSKTKEVKPKTSKKK